jgi:hypothetical protein
VASTVFRDFLGWRSRESNYQLILDGSVAELWNEWHHRMY